MTDPSPSRRLAGDAILGDALVRELLASRLVAVFATLDADGAVHAVPMWFAAHDGFVVLATSSRSAKVRNLERDPRATLVVHDSRAGYEVCGVMFAGEARVERGGPARELVDRVHRRYVTKESESLAAVRDYIDSDDVAIRFVPQRALTWDERGSEASRVLRDAAGALPLVPTEPGR